MTKQELAALYEALNHLVTYLDPTDEHCGVDPEARKASRIYLETWVAEPLIALARHTVGPAGRDQYLQYLGRRHTTGSVRVSLRKIVDKYLRS